MLVPNSRCGVINIQILSPTSVTNIDVTGKNITKVFEIIHKLLMIRIYMKDIFTYFDTKPLTKVV